MLIKRIFIGSAILLIGVVLWRCSFSSKKAIKEQTVSVVVAPTVIKDMPVYLSALGNVKPLDTVNVKTQVNGQLITVNVKEGQHVKKGDVLAEIDPRPYEAQVMQYEGQLGKDIAFLNNAKIDLERDLTLYPKKAISQQVLETQKWLVKQYEGTVKADQGLLNNARVNLDFCKIKSPLDGIVGLRLVDPGNYVQISDSAVLFVVNNLDPITVIFTLSEDYISTLFKKVEEKHPLFVEIYDRQDQLLETSSTVIIDNQVDPTTGTVKLKAEVANQKNRLFSNQFVKIKLKIDTLKSVIVVPTAAIQHGSNGDFVYRLNVDNRVSIQPVTASVTEKGQTVITKGLAGNQLVVTEGADKLIDGSLVKVGG